jgi:hypothetical protein
MRNWARDGGAVGPDGVNNWSEQQQETNYVEGKSYYVIVLLRTSDDQVEGSNCWQGIWFETNRFVYCGWAFENEMLRENLSNQI